MTEAHSDRARSADDSDASPADPPARVTVASLAPGAEVNETYLVRRAAVRTGRQGGGTYLAVTLGDLTGEVAGRVWDANAGMLNAFRVGTAVQVRALVEEYRGETQLNIQGFRPVAFRTLNARDFLPVSPHDPKALFAGLKEHLAGLSNPFLALLRDRYLADREFLLAFYTAPAAVSYHHAWVHGLLEHTVSALGLAHRVCDQYPALDRDIVVLAVFLHDAGKVVELTARGLAFEYSVEGQLLGHITLGVAELDRKIRTVPDFPATLSAHLRHCVLAHHGTREFGSPREPMSPEALAVHHIECLDAHLNAMWAEQREHAPGDAGATPAFAYSRRFHRTVFAPPLPPDVPQAHPFPAPDIADVDPPVDDAESAAAPNDPAGS